MPMQPVKVDLRSSITIAVGQQVHRNAHGLVVLPDADRPATHIITSIEGGDGAGIYHGRELDGVACRVCGYIDAGHTCCPPPRPVKVTLVVVLEIEATEAAHAFDAVDAVLDAGVFQDAINDHGDDCPPVHVRSAVCRSVADVGAAL